MQRSTSKPFNSFMHKPFPNSFSFSHAYIDVMLSAKFRPNFDPSVKSKYFSFSLSQDASLIIFSKFKFEKATIHSNISTYGLSCRKSAGCFSKHTETELNNIIKSALSSAEINSILEPPGLCRSNGKRVNGTSIISWSKVKLYGTPLALDRHFYFNKYEYVQHRVW